METGINGITALGFGLSEYTKMFALSDDELDMRILDCRAGASSFAADMHKLHKQVIACDPVYRSSIPELKQLVADATADIERAVHKNSPSLFVLPEKTNDFLSLIESGTQRFFDDFSSGYTEKRYTTDSLPHLSFKNAQFDLALVCHYLFTFSKQLSLDYHVQAIEELIRVANEVRIYPLVTSSGALSPYVGEVVAILQSRSYGVELRGVEFKLQEQGNAMLRVWAPECQLSLHKA